MDVVLEVADPLLFDWLYAQPPFSLGAAGPLFSERDGAVRQSLSLYLVTVVFGYVLYFLFGFLNYWLLYDKKQLQHPKFLPNQIRREITLSAASLPLMALLTLPVYLAEVRGYSRLYSDWSEYSLSYTCMSAIFFLLFTDACIYWIHRALHLPLFYAAFHKPHHLWKVPTPFASHAFHPIDGYMQSLPYHIFVFLFPLHKVLYLGLFVFVNFWTISIHDGNYVSSIPFINGAAHHTLHHLEYRYNFGQYFTLWDIVGGSYKKPKDDAPDCGADKQVKEE